jgi:drug/metabolite transporter (DMT)-like permease
VTDLHRVNYSPPTGQAAGVALLLVTVSIWGTQFPIAKATFDYVSAFHTAAFRYGVGVSILISMLILREGIRVFRFDRQGVEAASFGLVGMFGSPALVFFGLMHTRPEIVALIVAVQPAMTAVAEWLFRSRRPGRISVLCIVVAFAGVVIAVTRLSPGFGQGGGETMGNLLAVVGCACWVCYTMATERFRNWSVLRLTTLTMLAGTSGHIMLVIILTLTGVLVTPPLQDWLQVRYELLFLAVAGVVVAMLFWNAGTQRIGPINAMLFVNLVPIITFAMRYLQGYRFHPLELLGAVMVISALFANNLALRADLKSRERTNS